MQFSPYSYSAISLSAAEICVSQCCPCPRCPFITLKPSCSMSIQTMSPSVNFDANTAAVAFLATRPLYTVALFFSTVPPHHQQPPLHVPVWHHHWMGGVRLYISRGSPGSTDPVSRRPRSARRPLFLCLNFTYLPPASAAS